MAKMQVFVQNLTVADGLDNLSEREIVVGHLRLGRGRTEFCAARVIVRQPDDDEIRQIVRLFKLFQRLDELRRAPHVRHVQIPADGVRHHDTAATLRCPVRSE